MCRSFAHIEETIRRVYQFSPEGCQYDPEIIERLLFILAHALHNVTRQNISVGKNGAQWIAAATNKSEGEPGQKQELDKKFRDRRVYTIDHRQRAVCRAFNYVDSDKTPLATERSTRIGRGFK